MKTKTLVWQFPLPRTHTGVALGNGVQGLLVWGAEALHITVARAGFWDHRGGNPVLQRTTFGEVRRLLEQDDAPGLRALFGERKAAQHPQQYGGGRLELRLPGWRPRTATLDLRQAALRIEWARPGRRARALTLRQAQPGEVAWLEGDPALLRRLRVKLVPAWEHLRAHFAERGIPAPRRWAGRSEGGFEQTLPEDPPLAVAWRRRADGTLALATALGPEAGRLARERAAQSDLAAAAAAARAWWRQYWKDVPRLRLPAGDADLQRAYDYGLFKQAGLTPPHAPAATLQGPWMEEYQPPPWSNDYHFNINVQLVYSPCLPTNRPGHLAPLWDLIASWRETLQRNGEQFFGVPGAWMLPHAVDDRCQVVGSFWSGTIDQACAAWMGRLAWLHYRYTLDRAVLREVAWPLLNGAFNGYWGMLEEVDDGRGGKRWSLPVSVSPEFGAGTMRSR